jgi:uncharacterized protein (DUF1330 family)
MVEKSIDHNLPNINCNSCTNTNLCPFPNHYPEFSCFHHQNFKDYLSKAEKAINILNGRRFERGGCCKCMTTIWSDEAAIVHEDKMYHLVCFITKRAELAEFEVSRLSKINNNLEKLIKQRYR